MSEDTIEIKPTSFVKGLLQIGCTFMQVTEILKLIDAVCTNCWEAKLSCQCSKTRQEHDDTPIGQGYLDGVLVSAIPVKNQDYKAENVRLIPS